MVYDVRATSTFEQEYASAIRYLAEDLHSPAAADKLMSNMQAMRDVLALNPFVRAVSRKPLLEHLELREYIVKNYIVVYRVQEPDVFLEHFFHQRQDFEARI